MATVIINGKRVKIDNPTPENIQAVKDSMFPKETSSSVEKRGIIENAIMASKIPEQLSEKGLGMIEENIPIKPYGEEVAGGAINPADVMMLKAGVGALKEVAPSFVSPESLATMGALKTVQLAKPAIKAIGKGAGYLGETLSGMREASPKILEKIAEKPSLLFGKSRKAIGESYSKLASKKALEEGILGIEDIGEKKNVIFNAMEAAKEGLLNADEALIARQELWGLKKSLPKAYFNKAYKTLGDIAKTKYGELDELFKNAEISEMARRILPVTAKGKDSKTNAAIIAYVMKALAPLASPIVQSTIAASLGTGAKLVSPLLESTKAVGSATGVASKSFKEWLNNKRK